MKQRTPFALWLAVPAAAIAPLAWSGSAPAQRVAHDDDAFHRTGALAGWRIEMDGTLYLRIDHDAAEPAGGGDGRQTTTWFKTPPNQNAQVNMEEVLIEVIMGQQAVEMPPPLTLHGKVERGLDGTDREHAIPLTSVEG